jgi:hypothetical protein
MANSILLEKTIFLIPVKDDYESVDVMIQVLLNQSLELDQCRKVLVVDDGSNAISRAHALKLKDSVINFEVLFLTRRNGHQKAIVEGLRFIVENYAGWNVVIMDGDGEDSPLDALTLGGLMSNSTDANVICARRGKRFAGKAFGIGYSLYVFLFKKFVGFDFRSGNFMCISSQYLPEVLKFPGIKNHFAASVVRYSLGLEYETFDRARRIAGNSKMSISNLTIHAYGAFAVYADMLIARILILVSLLTAIFGVVVAIGITLKIFGLVEFSPGWISIILVQVISTVITLVVGSLIGILTLLRIDFEK